MSNTVEKFIPLSVPSIQGQEWKYVKDCLDSEWVSSAGPFVDRFELEFARYVGARHAIACSSGTAALHVALLLAGVKSGDLVLLPSLSFIATGNAVLYTGATPYFFDADEFYNLDLSQVLQFLEADCERTQTGFMHRASQKRVAAILPVHVFGNAVNYAKNLQALRTLGIPIIEDAAESLGTRYNDQALGHSGTQGLLGCFSFNGNKIATTGGGGMIVTNDANLAKKAKYLTTQAKDDEERFVHHEVGFNYRLTNVQAAIGVAQLERIEEFCAKKQQIFARYQEAFAQVSGLRMATVPNYARNNYWMPALQIDRNLSGLTPLGLMQALKIDKIQARPLWLPMHQQKPFLGCASKSLEQTEHLHAITLNIPCSTNLSEAEQTRVIQAILKARKAA